jgi:hypothetical protein
MIRNNATANSILRTKWLRIDYNRLSHNRLFTFENEPQEFRLSQMIINGLTQVDMEDMLTDSSQESVESSDDDDSEGTTEYIGEKIHL